MHLNPPAKVRLFDILAISKTNKVCQMHLIKDERDFRELIFIKYRLIEVFVKSNSGAIIVQ